MNRKIRALVVDDESLAREALLVLLDDDPEIEVMAECRNGREAVTVIREQSPDVVFLDIQMPEMDGFQVVEEVGAMQMPVTFSSPHTTNTPFAHSRRTRSTICSSLSITTASTPLCKEPKPLSGSKNSAKSARVCSPCCGT